MNELVSASQDRSHDSAPSQFARLRGGFRSLLRHALDAALPPLCPSCREPLGDGAGLCAACWSKLSFIEPPYCARLGIPFTYDPGPRPAVDGSHRRPAGLRPGARRGAL
jgi:hypothetical protein